MSRQNGIDRSLTKQRRQRSLFSIGFLSFPWVLVLLLWVFLPFRCGASFVCGVLICVTHLGLIYWSWICLLSQKKLALWTGFLVLKYGLVFLVLYWLLKWIHLLCFSGGFIVQGIVMIVVFLLSKKGQNQLSLKHQTRKRRFY